MNLTRHRSSRARGARRQTLRRSALLTLACLVAMAGSNFKFAGAQTGTATKQQRTKLSAPVSKTALTALGQVNKPVKGMQAQSVEPNVTTCANPKIPINQGQSLDGALASTDCPLADGTFYDEYTFSAVAGQQVSITLSSNAFDTYLFLLKPSQTVVPATSATDPFQNDDGGIGGAGTLGGNANSNSRIPATSGVITLPETGTYSILANSFEASAFGSYTVALTFGSTGGTICNPIVPTPIANAQILNGSLSSGDCTLAAQDGTNPFYDAYSFTANAGQQVSLTLTGTGFDAYLLLLAPDGTDIAEDNDGGGNKNARIPQTAGFARLPQTGTYIIYTTSALTGETGSYTISLNFGSSNCTSTPITIGQTVNGVALESTDCRLPEDGSFLDTYTFNGTAGQRITITMAASAGGLNPFLFLLSPTGTSLANTVNVSNASVNSVRIPDTPGAFFTLPTTGTYTILANSFATGQLGAYTLTATLAAAPCTYTLAQASASVSGTAGNFSVGVTTQPLCGLTAAQVTSNASWLTVGTVTVDDNGNGTVNYSVAANTVAAPRTGTLTIAGQTFTVTQAAGGPLCTYTLAPASATVPGAGGSFSVNVNTQAGCGLTVSQVTSNDSWLTVNSVTASGSTGTVNYTAAPNGTGVPRSGTLSIAGQTFTVTQPEVTPVATTLQFSAANYTVGEGNGQATITVTRLNDTGGTATVNYRTADNDTFTVNCTAAQGTAFGRCDFATTVDTLTFAPGETQKSFVVPIIDDAHVEGNETLQVILSNPTGAALGTQTNATLTITDNDVAGQANPIFQTPFFVRQQYLDFLAREPEAGEPWSGVLNRCPDVNNVPANNPSANCDRINVSGSFFGSPEFKDKGVYIIVFYRVAFNRLPTYTEFAVDLRNVTGTTAQETFAKRAAFAASFTQRPEFVSAYGAQTDTAYVASLLARYNNLAAITTIDPNNPDGTTKVTLTQNDLVNRLSTGALTRAQVLRAIVQSDQISAQAEAINAFVASQYYGYLRRTPDTGGFNGWVGYLRANPTDFRTMVNGFLNSVEYRLRFGANTQ